MTWSRRSRPVALAVFASTLVSPALGQTVSFSPQREFPVGNGPFWLTAGDFNGDGKKDLATSNRGSNDVSVLLGNGDGTFQAARSFPAGGGASYVGVGDFNRDGIQDLVTADYYAGTVTVLRGVGDGTFLAPQSFPAGGTNPNCLAVGEFNGDGAEDLAVAVFGGNTPDAKTAAVLVGTGTGAFQPAVGYTAERGPLWVELGDVNGDGKQDLLVANFGQNTVSLLLGNGDGTFQAARSLPGGACGTNVDCGAAAVAVGDFNGDGFQDLVVVDYRSFEIAVMLGNGDGTFGASVAYPVGLPSPATPSPATIVVADINGDGVQDLVVPNWNYNSGNTVSVLLGNGNGTFQAAQTMAIQGGRGVLGVVAADFNGDGLPDVAISNYAGNSVSVLTNANAPPSGVILTVNRTGTGSGTVTSTPAGITCGSTCTATYSNGTVVTLTAAATGGSTFAGWSGGGCSGTGTCSVTMNVATTVTATFTAPPQQFSLTVGKAGSGTGTVTSNPAGINCGATCSALYDSGTVVTLTASAAGGSTFGGWSGGSCSGTGTCSVTITAATTVTASFSAAIVSAPVLKWQYGGCTPGPFCDTGWYSSPAVADLDGDGQPEVIWGAYDVVALNGADGGQKWRAASPNRVWPGIAVADLTGDGTQEVIVGRSSDQLTVYNRTGGVLWTRNPFGNGEVRSLAVADLESDGQLEIVVGHAGDPGFQLNAYEPNGSVRPGWPARHPGEPGYGSGLFNENVAVADMRGDGFKEVFGPASAHYITALDRSGNQLPADAIYNSISPAGPKVWSQVGVHVDNSVDLRGFANCGVEHRPDFSESAPVIADVDGDGVPELIVVGSVYNCSTGADLYHAPFILKLDRTRWSGRGFDWTAIPTPGPGAAPRSLDSDVIEHAVPNPVVADLDGDGFKEILYPSYDGKLHAYWLDKTEHGSWPYTVPTSGAAGDDFRFASEPVVADLDNDGHAEVIFTSWPKKATGRVGQLHVLDYLGVELYRIDLSPAALDAGWNGGLGAPTLANIDDDADLELVVGTVGSGVAAYDLPNSPGARILWGTGRGSARRAGTASP